MKRLLPVAKSSCTVLFPSPLKRVAMDSQSASTHRAWTFLLRTALLEPCEVPAITGDCVELGSWSAISVHPLDRATSPGLWTTTIQIPIDKDVRFRYCVVCVSPTDAKRVQVRSWETNIEPRQVLKSSTESDVPDIYGEYNNVKKIDKGWLMNETVLQLKFHNNPFIFKSDVNTIQIKLTPINRSDCDNTNKIRTDDSELAKCTVTQVATIDSTDHTFVQQSEFGKLYKNNDFLIFNIIASDLNDLAYSVDFYNELSGHFGCGYILPNTLKNTSGSVVLPITCSTKQTPLGTMDVDYLIVRAMPENLCDMSVSYANHWDKKWTGLEIGHRGSGSSFNSDRNPIRENTIASLKKAAADGADMLEFDVQLSKDLVPVIYHDYHICVSLQQKNTDKPEMFQIPIQDLTLERLQKTKTYHKVESESNEVRIFKDDDLVENQPFPQLSELFGAIDPNVGFNIEIKSESHSEDGKLELEHPMDLNLYLDKILEVVLKFGGKRHIVFSSFNPDVCTMLKLKQNRYPAMFLTQGVTTKYPGYRDIRCNSIPAAVHNALNTGLLGIVVHTEDILRDPSQVKMAIDAGLVIMCWGEDNNNSDKIRYLKGLGLHGVIFDKFDKYTTKETKDSIFLVKANQTASDNGLH